DFAAIRRALGIPAEHDILHHLAALPAEQAAAKHAWLLEHERELALAAQPASGAVELVRALRGRGCRLGILTRNAYELALITLQRGADRTGDGRRLPLRSGMRPRRRGAQRAGQPAGQPLAGAGGLAHGRLLGAAGESGGVAYAGSLPPR